MPLQCPACGQTVRAEHVDVGLDAATCPHCQESFRPSSTLPPIEASASRSPTPPPGVLDIEYPPEGGIRVHIPAAGLTAKAMGTFGFALLWNLILAAVFGGFLIGMLQGEVPLAMLLFFLPFIAVGVVMAYIGCRLAWGRTTLWLDRDGFAIVRELFGRQRSRSFLLEDVEGFSREVSYTQNDMPVYACRARVRRKKVNFGHRLSEVDQDWLVAELNRILSRLRA
ncbi:MAG: hypothetical protein ACUVXJ_08505 [Phycisphaerae bacterium]